MASLSNVLASIPGMAGYYAKDQLNREQTAGDLQQIGALSQLQAQMQNRQRQEAARQALSGLGPDATEDQRVQALLPHIGDPDKIAGILQNASLRKAQQEQTKQLAMTRLQQQASQHLDNLAVKVRNATTAEERSHWEQQIALAQLGFKQQAADIAAGRYNYETGMTVPSLPRPFVPGAVGASPGQAAPTPQPAPSAAPGPSAVPGGAVPLGIRNNNPGNLRPVGSSVGFQQFASPEEGLAALDRNLLAYANTGINTLEGVINRWAPPSENDTGAYVRAAAQRLGIDPKQPLDLKNPIQRQAVATAIMLHENGPQGLFGGGQQQPTPAVPAPAPVTPAAPNNLDARDLRLASMPNGGAPAVPVAASPQPAPQAAPQPAPRKQLTIDDAPAGLTPRGKQEWLMNEAKKQGDAEKVGRDAVVRQVTKDLGDAYTKLRDAPQAIANIERAKALIPDSKAFQGSLGEQKLAAAKFFNNNLGMSINLSGVESAEELRSRIFFNIMDNLKKMDSQPSENQQRIMQEALGKLGADPNALPRILDAFGDVIRDKVAAYDKQVEEAKTSGVNWPHRISIPQRNSPSSGAVREFATEADAAAAGLAPGTRVKIGGKTGTWK